VLSQRLYAESQINTSSSFPLLLILTNGFAASQWLCVGSKIWAEHLPWNSFLLAFRVDRAALNSALLAYLAPPGHHAGFAVGIGTVEQPPLQGETHRKHFPLTLTQYLAAPAVDGAEDAGGTVEGALDGLGVGVLLGASEGVLLGAPVGVSVGLLLGASVGVRVGSTVEGALDGLGVGVLLGASEGVLLGAPVGDKVGARVGLDDGAVVGFSVGDKVGAKVGLVVGAAVQEPHFRSPFGAHAHPSRHPQRFME